MVFSLMFFFVQIESKSSMYILNLYKKKITLIGK